MNFHNRDDFLLSIKNGRCFVFLYIKHEIGAPGPTREEIETEIENMRDDGFIPEEYTLTDVHPLKGLVDESGMFYPGTGLPMTRVKLSMPVPDPVTRKIQLQQQEKV